MNQVGVYHERVYADDVLSNFSFVRSFSSQHHSHFIANIATNIVSQVRTKEWKTRSSIWKVNPIFLRSSRHFNCGTAFALIVSFLNEGAHGFNDNRIGSVKTGFHLVKSRRLLTAFYQRTQTFHFSITCYHFGILMGKIFLKLQPLIDFSDSVVPVKNLYKNWLYCPEKNVQTHWKAILS